ncbi:NAD-binding protein [Mariniluteicoccus flavus]
MVNPLQLLAHRVRVRRRPPHSLRRVDVAVPTQVPGTDAIFLVLRRMRTPLIAIVAIFAFCVVGLSLMPGTDGNGNPHRLTLFDAFYVMSYTATTIGFGEIPYAFSYPQRLWVTLSIYLTVTGWAYAVSALFGLLQETGFREAIATQRFRRRVATIKEPFWIVAGYGQTGRAVANRLDELGRRFVVVDDDPARVERLEIDQHNVDVPGIDGDVSNPALLGLAGLDQPHCEGVLALASDEANLAVVMTVNLLRPDVAVIASCDDRATARRMEDFAPDAIINPYDRYGAYLALRLQRPGAFQLAQWLMSTDGDELRERAEGLDAGHWIVAADDAFGHEVAADLRAAGLEVREVDPADGDPDVTGAAGLVAGSANDVVNLSLAAHARIADPDLFLSVRQRSDLRAAALKAFDADSLLVPSDLVAREVVARVMAPAYWDFIDHVLTTDDETWAEATLAALRSRVGDLSPSGARVTIDASGAPAVVRWITRGGTITIGDLLRDPSDRDSMLPAFCLSLLRDGQAEYAPDEDTELAQGDALIVAGTPEALQDLVGVLDNDTTTEHLVTGEDVPATWLWRTLRRRRVGALRR